MKLDPKISAAYEIFWSALCKQGDPLHIPNKFIVAFEAGYKAGMREGERMASRDAADIAAERSWRDKQGDEYGSY